MRRSLQTVEGQASEVRRALQALRTRLAGLDSANRSAEVVTSGLAPERSHTQTLRVVWTQVHVMNGANR